MKIELQINAVYHEILDAPQSLQILFGGSSSGKSRFEAQRCIYDLLRGSRNYLITRKVQKHLRGSVFKELNQVIRGQDLTPYFKINQTELTLTCLANGFQAVCVGLDDPEKIKSVVPEKGVYTDAWLEEATELTEDDYRQIQRRMRGKAGVPKRITLTFNPILKSHWIAQRWFKDWADDEKKREAEDHLILKTTYKDNRFLDSFELNVLENEQDEYTYQVYTLGQWGVLGDVIFTNYEIKDLHNDPIRETFDIFRNGLDFGYANDPTAFNRLYYHRATKKLYVLAEWTAKGITNDRIAQAIKPALNGDYVVCDSAEPKSIAELNNHGLRATGARKGKDSVSHGLQWLKQQKIVIDKNCVNTINNFQQYHWKKDKDGQSMNVPIDKYNDHIDAIRYACEDLMFDSSGIDIVATDSILAGADY